jgi:UDP-glucose 4-epimerase
VNVVITGGAGYIGSVMTELFIESGHKVTIIDNLSRGFKEAVHKDAKFIEADIRDFENVISAEDKIDAVVHMAAFAYVGESVQKPEIYWDNNVVGTLGLLSGMRTLGIKKLVFASTCATYGVPKTMPITEDLPRDPVNAYGMSKLAIDMAITSESTAHGLTATSLRFFNVAGAYKSAGERHAPETHIIPLALAAAMGEIQVFKLYGDDYDTPDGSCIRDYIHVLDLAKAALLTAEKAKQGVHSIYNIGNGKGFSNKEVINAVEKVSDKKINVKIESRRPGDPPTLVASSEKITAELGWSPTRPNIEDMIKDGLEFYKSIHS